LTGVSILASDIQYSIWQVASSATEILRRIAWKLYQRYQHPRGDVGCVAISRFAMGIPENVFHEVGDCR